MSELVYPITAPDHCDTVVKLFKTISFIEGQIDSLPPNSPEEFCHYTLAVSALYREIQTHLKNALEEVEEVYYNHWELHKGVFHNPNPKGIRWKELSTE